MGNATPIIRNVQVSEYSKVIVETSDGKRYFSDLSALAQVYCFPSDMSAWSKISIDSYGLGLIWASRFEVHVDQVIGLAFKIEETMKSASGH